MSWIKVLYHRAHKIWSNKQSLNKQLSQIRTFLLWNGYPKRIQSSVIRRLKTNRSPSRLTDDNDKKNLVRLTIQW